MTSQHATYGAQPASLPASAPISNYTATRVSRLYSLVMTPINFVSFLFSIALVELQYSHARFQTHAYPRSWLPNWLYEWLYPSPYGNYDSPDGADWHYHSHQRGIIKMEAEDAFRMRKQISILLTLCVIAIISVLLYSANLAQTWLRQW